jgi:hypothetical protein
MSAVGVMPVHSGCIVSVFELVLWMLRLKKWDINQNTD